MIKKISNSLYSNIFIKIVLSVVMALIVFYFVSTGTTSFLENRRIDYLNQYNNDLDLFTSRLQENIINNSLEENDIIDGDYLNSELFNIEIHSDQTIIELDSSEYGIIREINFERSIAYLSINPIGYARDLQYMQLATALFSIILFFVFVTMSLSPIVKYVKDIERSIAAISTDNLSVKAPIKGKNELTYLAEGINAMGVKLEMSIEKERSLNDKQRQLITNLSHDLRTPLTSILGYIDLSKKAVDENSEVYKYIAIVEKNGISLKRHIDDLFLYSQAMSNDLKITKSKVKIDLILNQIIDMYYLNIEYISKKEQVYINIDPQYYYRIISNLLSNCEKYGIQNEKVVVEVESDDEYGTVSISNKTNLNLTDDLPYLKERLYFSNDSRNINATGLGLAIAFELCEHMDGKLELYYNKNTFTAKVFMPIIKE